MQAGFVSVRQRLQVYTYSHRVEHIIHTMNRSAIFKQVKCYWHPEAHVSHALSKAFLRLRSHPVYHAPTSIHRPHSLTAHRLSPANPPARSPRLPNPIKADGQSHVLVLVPVPVPIPSKQQNQYRRHLLTVTRDIIVAGDIASKQAK